MVFNILGNEEFKISIYFLYASGWAGGGGGGDWQGTVATDGAHPINKFEPQLTFGAGELYTWGCGAA